MQSLWGSKKNNDDQPEDHADEALIEQEPAPMAPRPASREEREGREPDERSRLLPPSNNNPPPRGAYLDPDDPAVCFTNYV